MRCAYFARPITLFGTNEEALYIADIKALGVSIIEINVPEIQEQYKSEGMSVFKSLICGADVLFFIAFDDGAIGAGVMKEILWAQSFHIPIFEIPKHIEARRLTVEETRGRLQKRLADVQSFKESLLDNGD